jgi:antitoxin PrlF
MTSIDIIEETSTITAKGQTTVPKAVRQALGVGVGDQIAFRIDEHGVTVHRVEVAHEDPAIGAFLAFLAKDIEANPQNIRGLPTDLRSRIGALVGGVEFDTDASLDGDVDL